VLQTGGLFFELRTPLGPACTPATQPYGQLCRHVAAPPRRVRTEWPSVRGPSFLIFNSELTERISDNLHRSERRHVLLPNTFLPSVAVGFFCLRSQCRYSALSLPHTLTKRDKKYRHEPIKVFRFCILPRPSVLCEYYCSCILLAVFKCQPCKTQSLLYVPAVLKLRNYTFWSH
jgi:hypothetical protein